MLNPYIYLIHTYIYYMFYIYIGMEHAYIYLITYEPQISAIKLTLYSADKTFFCPSAFSPLTRGLFFFCFTALILLVFSHT